MKDSENSGKTVHMVVTALRDGGKEAESRTSLKEDGNGNLAFTWSAGDQLLVTDGNGLKKGVLKLTSGAGEDNGTFEGDLRGLDNGTVKLNYYYLGLKHSQDKAENGKGYQSIKGEEPYTADYTKQEGSLESLSDYDMLSQSKSTVISGDYSYSEFIDLKRRVSFARFLMILPNGAEAPYKVTLSGTELGNKATINLTDGDAPLEKMKYDKGNVVLENLASNDFYITYVPTQGKYDITFTVEDKNNKSYTGTYTIKSDITQSQYLRRKNEDGTYQGVPVDFTEDNSISTPGYFKGQFNK